jgi:hypothetical protein
MHEVVTALPHRPLRGADVELLGMYRGIDRVYPIEYDTPGENITLFAVTPPDAPVIYGVGFVDGDWRIVDTFELEGADLDADHETVAAVLDELDPRVRQ